MPVKIHNIVNSKQSAYNLQLLYIIKGKCNTKQAYSQCPVSSLSQSSLQSVAIHLGLYIFLLNHRDRRRNRHIVRRYLWSARYKVALQTCQSKTIC